MTVERWTDEMLDRLASSVNDLSVTSQALLQLAAQQQQKSREIDDKLVKLEEEKAENDRRFNVLLEEVRFLIRNQNNNSGNS
jgi:septal ring factor EnvC (AmiA/AmiB activator)